MATVLDRLFRALLQMEEAVTKVVDVLEDLLDVFDENPDGDD